MGNMEIGTVGTAKAKRGSIRAKVFNADGTLKEDLGLISYYHRNPFKRLFYKLTGIGL